ncbi:recombinase family protein [Pseudoalteromonas sp. MMG024]|uniref:recombinase family protein n=1 Tax=Pseudoalteromonas sp. MMG024 TaxID=2909980 RepID=UPI001F01BBD6|nr:recombinase family protein [Pseudoalteromonas sp. MMG024]MCF6459103.1 recombinase family protein [Pseudoalteromonas sp. MMG024]
MAKIYAYTRVSDPRKQSADAQKEIIRKYANRYSLIIDEWINKEVSGSSSTREERGIISLLDNITAGDIILVSDLDRLGRDSIASIVNTLTSIIDKRAELHLCSIDERFTENNKNDLASFFIQIGRAFAAQDFSRNRSLKAKAAIQRRIDANLNVGRQPGTIVKSYIDDSEVKIIFWLNQQIPVAQIARSLDIPYTSLKKWIERRNELICQAIDLNLYTPGMSLKDIKNALRKHYKLNNTD